MAKMQKVLGTIMVRDLEVLKDAVIFLFDT
jgi:hypothetical protein